MTKMDSAPTKAFPFNIAQIRLTHHLDTYLKFIDLSKALDFVNSEYMLHKVL